jgi:hypothetical protein
MMEVLGFPSLDAEVVELANEALLQLLITFQGFTIDLDVLKQGFLKIVLIEDSVCHLSNNAIGTVLKYAPPVRCSRFM